jgi:dUTP pyrophosphatase
LTAIRFALWENDSRYAPAKAHADDACYDLLARSYSLPESLAGESPVLRLPPGRRCLARTGVFLQLAPGWEALVRPRSGNALKLGLTVLNSPGTIDAGYRDEIGVVLLNAGREELELRAGMKIAQIAFRAIAPHLLEPVAREEFRIDTERGLGGFGSSGS